MPCAEQRALLEMNLRRETWCQVEVNPARSWERTERRHYRGHLRTGPIDRSSSRRQQTLKRPEETSRSSI
ncbi:hypothetical protein EYF80_050630 [Liparis tanakae]|uniref:Uncharacterized protein n=1 Tax=Liparis tanakae TaxID=230148 RepID=A0A4Z2FDI6_9TELE|nr:hypothetical protein EYF80_050630 [Liparis tanakae]